MKRIRAGMSFALFAAVLLMLAGGGCVGGMGREVVGSGISKTESREVAADFNKVSLTGAANVHVTVGDKTSVIVTADDNILPMIETRITGDELRIICHGNYRPRTHVRVDITTPTLSDFALAGSGNVDITGLTGPSFRASISGSGDFKATGQVDSLAASISGSGGMDLVKVVARSADVSIAGSGDVSVMATESVSASVSGSGDIRYAGNPSKVNSHVSGSGSVRKI